VIGQKDAEISKLSQRNAALVQEKDGLSKELSDVKAQKDAEISNLSFRNSILLEEKEILASNLVVNTVRGEKDSAKAAFLLKEAMARSKFIQKKYSNQESLVDAFVKEIEKLKQELSECQKSLVASNEAYTKVKNLNLELFFDKVLIIWLF
jgi:tRNA 2-selenouridine synthase SelU